ncbi:MAG: dockerin type I repeat-containing protein, partial [Clostridia bacterium]|nr:dockerin type I repeat-containing protein [Clostridia bacterium]
MKKSITWIVVLSMILSMIATSGWSVPAASYYVGDVNGDGNVTTYDARLLLSTIVSGTTMTVSQRNASDMNGDGLVNTSDVKLILDRVMNATMGSLAAADLLAPTLDDWNNPIQAVGQVHCTIKQEEASGGGYVFKNVTETDEGTAGTMLNPFTWPYSSYSYDKKLLAPSTATITYDVTVACSSASLNLYIGGDIPHFDDSNAPNYIVLNSYITSNLDPNSGDMMAGTYSGTISIGDILNSGKVPSECIVNNCLWISGVKLYVAGYNDDSATIRKLSLSAAYTSDADLPLSSDPLEAVRSNLIIDSELTGLSALTGMEMYTNGVRTTSVSLNTYTDYKKIYKTQHSQRVMNYPDGYKIDIPYDWKPDYSLSEIRSRYESKDCVLTVSKEQENPYSNTLTGWETYLTEWLNPYISNENFLSQNYMRYQRDPIVSEYMLSGYTVMTYDIAIDWQGDIDMPYYSI